MGRRYDERARIWSRGFDGRLGRYADVVALLDASAVASLIGSELAARLGGATLRYGVPPHVDETPAPVMPPAWSIIVDDDVHRH